MPYMIVAKKNNSEPIIVSRQNNLKNKDKTTDKYSVFRPVIQY